MPTDTDHLGRPIVVITGMGVLSSLGQGQTQSATHRGEHRGRVEAGEAEPVHAAGP